MKGFTLVEIMISLLIFSLIFMATFMVLSGGQSSWYIGDAKIQLNQELRRPLLTMNRELRQTRSSEIIGVPADDNFYTSITFRIPEDVDVDGDVIDALGNIEWSGNINYSLNASNQIVRSSPSGTSILANNVSGLQFMRPSGSPNTIDINISVQKTTTLGRNLQAGITSSVKMRN